MKIFKSTAFALAVILAAGNFPGFCGTEIYTEKFCSAAGISENISEEGLVYTETDGEIHITGIIENIQSVVIPDKIDNKPVTLIGESAFSLSDLQMAVVPETVKVICFKAFQGIRTVIIHSDDCEIDSSYMTISGGTVYCNKDSSADEYCRKNGYTSRRIEDVPDIVFGVTDDGFLYKSENGTVSVTGYAGNERIPVIPEYIEDSPVTRIAVKAFYKADIDTAVISDKVEVIESDAFTCSNIKYMIIPETVKEIHNQAFDICEKMDSVYILNPDCDLGYDLIFPETKKCVLFESDVIIKAAKGSEAERFAAVYGYDFEELSDIPEFTVDRTDDGYRYFSDGSHVTILGCELNGTKAVVPSEINGCPVTRIAAGGIASKNVTEIVIPESVNTVSNKALLMNPSLTSVTFLNPECRISDKSTVLSYAAGQFKGTIYGFSGSTTEKYAEKFRYNFEALHPAGDMDGNDIIDVTDLSIVSLAVIGDKVLTAEQIKAGDINENGKVDLADLARLRQYISGVVISLPLIS